MRKRVQRLILVCIALASVGATAEEKDVAELYRGLVEKKDLAVSDLAPGLKAGMLLELEAYWSEQGEADRSDIVVGAFQLTLDADPVEGMSGRVLLLYEEGYTDPMDVDEAFVKLGDTESMPAWIRVGRLYVPFGVFNSHFVSDPLTLKLGQTRAGAAMVGWGTDLMQLQAGCFNGKVDEDSADEDDRVDGAVASLTVTPFEFVEGGFYYITDMGESWGMQDVVKGYQSYCEAGGVGGYVSVTLGRFVLDAEAMKALDDVAFGVVLEEEEAETQIQPMAWNCELAFRPNDLWEFAGKIEGSDEYPDKPETQYGAVVSRAVMENAAVKLEYLHGMFDNADDRDMVTGQLALEF